MGAGRAIRRGGSEHVGMFSWCGGKWLGVMVWLVGGGGGVGVGTSYARSGQFLDFKCNSNSQVYSRVRLQLRVSISDESLPESYSI